MAVNRAVEPERPDTADPEASLAIGNEERKGHDENGEIVQIIGDVKGKGALIVDDFSLSAWTVVEAARAVMGSGASKVVALVTHGVFAEGARSRIDAGPIDRLFVTDTIETPPIEFPPKVEVVSVAGLFGEAIRRVHQRGSISFLLPKQGS